LPGVRCLTSCMWPRCLAPLRQVLGMTTVSAGCQTPHLAAAWLWPPVSDTLGARPWHDDCLGRVSDTSSGGGVAVAPVSDTLGARPWHDDCLGRVSDTSFSPRFRLVSDTPFSPTFWPVSDTSFSPTRQMEARPHLRQSANRGRIISAMGSHPVRQRRGMPLPTSTDGSSTTVVRRLPADGREGVAPWTTQPTFGQTPPFPWRGLPRDHRRVTTISMYSLGTTTAESPERLKRSICAVMSAVSAVCAAGSSAPNALSSGP